METVRIDKWLWAARFFKTRALAVKACDLGRVKLRDQVAKPSRDVKPGDAITVTNEGGTFTVDVLLLSDVRGPAAVAQTLYRETEASIAERAREADARKSIPWFDQQTSGRPSKRDRRHIHSFLGR